MSRHVPGSTPGYLSTARQMRPELVVLWRSFIADVQERLRANDPQAIIEAMQAIHEPGTEKRFMIAPADLTRDHIWVIFEHSLSGDEAAVLVQAIRQSGLLDGDLEITPKSIVMPIASDFQRPIEQAEGFMQDIVRQYVSGASEAAWGIIFDPWAE